ncbi:MAG: HlyD family efflux transporter periplasmic adaptor subunit [Burkholderiales bacterium]|nr:HlyD family efflux transporter periplasmic adaptor subunit [Burkholderiales bacterium]
MKSSIIPLVFAALIASIANAGPGHDHGDAAPAGNANGPQRQPDGSVFLPKPAQRQLNVRTTAVALADLSRTTELAGKVMMDVNAGGKVQPMIAGRIEAGPKGLPNPGQSVRKGEVLAYVVPSAGQIEKSNQAAQIAELRATKSLAEKKLARQNELADTIPRKEIEATESEISSLNGRLNALGIGLNNRDVLIAPVSGVIAQANAANGQVVDAREVVFEIVDPTRLRIEALSFEPTLAVDIASASIAIGEKQAPLTFVGATRMLREQALPLVFKANDATLSALAVGQPVRVFVQSKAKVKAIAVAAASIMKNPSNQSIVWVKSAPEKFEPRIVTTEPLDGLSVAVISGLKAGDRVVTSGATLINQVR